MCPDPQLLSTYIDEELPSPWKEKMETHLEKCSPCREKLESLSKLQQLFKKNTHQRRTIVESDAAERSNADSSFVEQFAEHEFLEAAKDRVWRNLQSKGRRRSNAVWQRRLLIPLPAAAAAAVIIAVITVVLARGGFNTRPPVHNFGTDFMLAAEEEIPVFPTMDMDSVLHYLGADGAEVLVIQLPESRSFSRTGDPAIVRAADYSRRQR